MNCLIKKNTYTTDKNHILSGNTYAFHMNMFLILLIYHVMMSFLFSMSLH